MNRALNALYPVAMAAGLAGIAGAGLAASRNHPVALAMTVLIAVFFLIGAWELAAFRRDSRGLAAAAERETAEDWMSAVPLALRSAVQMRLDGLRVVLPGLALAPAIAGLLVLLGMLGTFIGLVITMGGTASALGASADLAALRAALGAPIQGLGLAFSASVAGVAGSAMLGLMVALARRERAAAAARLDAALLGPLRTLTAAHRREIERQAAQAAAIEREDARQREMVAQLQQFSERIAEQLSAQNSRFHGETSQAYAALASSVDATLRGSLAEAAREAGAAIQPAAEAAMAGIAREAAALHERVGGLVGDQLSALGSRFEAGAGRIAQQQAEASRAQDLALGQQREQLAQAAREFTAQTQTLLDRVAEGQAVQQRAWATQREEDRQLLRDNASRVQAALAEMARLGAEQTQAAVTTLAEGFARVRADQAGEDAERLAAWRAELQSAGAAQLQQQRQLADGLLANTRELVAQAEASSQKTLAEAGALLQAAGEAPRAAVEVVDAMREQLAQSQAQDRAALVERAEVLESMSTLMASLRQAMGEVLAQAGQQFATQREQAQQVLDEGGARVQAALSEMSRWSAEQTQAAVTTLAQGFSQLREDKAGEDAERLAAWRAELQSAGAAQLQQQRQLADGLLANTRELVAQAEASSQKTLAEAGALLQAAGEAPRAAVEVVDAMREQLAQSQAQDRAALLERAELMSTVSTLLASLQQAAGEQRAAIDALVDRSAMQLEASGHALSEAATNLAASAADVASLGEGFGVAVEQFQDANAQLVQHLSALEERLDASMTRSDEQLGYYVAQARELIDLCLGSQKQVLDALQGAAAHG